MQKGKYFWKLLTFYSLVVCILMVVAINNIPSNETVVKMKRITADMLSQFV